MLQNPSVQQLCEREYLVKIPHYSLWYTSGAIIYTAPQPTGALKSQGSFWLELRWALHWVLLVLPVAGLPGVVARLQVLEASNVSSLGLLFGIQLPTNE